MSEPMSAGLQSLLSGVESSAHMRDLRIAAEYKHCSNHAPGGVFIVPDLSDLRKFYGVIFVRRGLYRNGVFRFVVKLPPTYNSHNSHPEVVFTPTIFHPLINAKVSDKEFYLTVADRCTGSAT